MAGNPWWIINGTSGNPPQFVLTQNGTKPAPANSNFAVSGPYSSQAAALAALPANAKYSIQKWNSAAGTLGAIIQGLTDAATGTTGPGTTGQGSGSGSPCLISAPSVNLVITSVGGGCIFTKTNARALVGGLILGAAGILAVVGLSLLVVEGFQSSGAGERAGRSLETVGAGLAFVPGLEPAGLAVGGAGAAARRAGSRSGASQSLGRRTAAREAAAREAAAQQRAAAAKQAGATP